MQVRACCRHAVECLTPAMDRPVEAVDVVFEVIVGPIPGATQAKDEFREVIGIDKSRGSEVTDSLEIIHYRRRRHCDSEYRIVLQVDQRLIAEADDTVYASD